MEAASLTPPRFAPARLSHSRIALLAGWGILLWLIAVLMIRAAPASLFDRGIATMLLFAAAVPNAWLTVWLTRRVASLVDNELVPGVAVACIAAMLLNGIALTWTTLYAPEAKDLVPADALLLWGVALILVAAFAMTRRAP